MSEIYKLQVSVATSEESQQYLLYNEDRSVYLQGEVTEEIADFMGGVPKLFCHCNISDSGNPKVITLLDLAPHQTW